MAAHATAIESATHCARSRAAGSAEEEDRAGQGRQPAQHGPQPFGRHEQRGKHEDEQERRQRVGHRVVAAGRVTRRCHGRGHGAPGGARRRGAGAGCGWDGGRGAVVVVAAVGGGGVDAWARAHRPRCRRTVGCDRACRWPRSRHARDHGRSATRAVARPRPPTRSPTAPWATVTRVIQDLSVRDEGGRPAAVEVDHVGHTHFGQHPRRGGERHAAPRSRPRSRWSRGSRCRSHPNRRSCGDARRVRTDRSRRWARSGRNR